jgi:hypothetical protein
MDEIARLTPSFAGVSYDKLDKLGSVQWPCNEKAPTGTPLMHVDRFVRGKGKFMITEYRADRGADRRALPADPDHGPHPLAIQCRGADATHREQAWHDEDVLEIHPFDAENRGIKSAIWWRCQPLGRYRAAGRSYRADAAGRGLHHLPPCRDRRQRDHHRLFGLGDELPGIQGDGGRGPADELLFAVAGEEPGRGCQPQAGSRSACRMPRNSPPAQPPASHAVPAEPVRFGARRACATVEVAVEAPVNIVYGNSPMR